MKKSKLNSNLARFSMLLKILLLLTVVLSFSQCNKPTNLTNKKVLVTSVGEVQEASCYAGEEVTFKIYYVNTQTKAVDIEIIDTLSVLLKDITLKNGGKLEKPNLIGRKTGQIAKWIIPNVASKKGGFVEFTATISENNTSTATKDIVNRAQINFNAPGTAIKPSVQKPAPEISKVTKPRFVLTNRVTIHICGYPNLGWLPFKNGATERDEPFYALKDETTMGILVNFEFPGMHVKEKIIKKVVYHEVSIPTLSTLNIEGEPALPIAGKIIEIPKDVNFTIEIFKSDSVKFNCYNVIPYQTLDTEADTIPDFTINSSIYRKNAFFPGKLSGVSVQDMGIVRGHRLIFLKAYPVQFNPAKKSITAFSQIEVRVKYDKPGQIEPISKRLYSPAFEEILESAVYNYKFDRATDGLDAEGGEDNNPDKRFGCDYLIICEDSLYDANDANDPINKLVHWKTRKGLVTEVVKISTIGNNAASIRKYIEDAYLKWPRVPSYVVLIGDANHITPDYRTNHNSHKVVVGVDTIPTMVGTDLYYSAVDGADYFPDLILSRISVDNVAQLTAVIDKSILYEQNPPANAAYYNNTSLVRLFEDDTDVNADGTPDVCPSDNMEDCWWVVIERAEEMRDYLVGEGYTADRIYNFSGGIANGPQRWNNGTNLPNHLTMQNPNPFPWNGNANDIEDAFDNGNFLITYRGHGGRGGWSRPSFRIANISNLVQNNMPAFVFAPTCQTGWFDNETDHANLPSNNDCFAEELLRADGCGAIGIVASARNSWGDCNNPLTQGLCDALWPNFDNTIHGGFLSRMGQIFVYSKTYLAQNVGAGDHRLITFEMTHLFGDPEIPIWISEPGKMDVSYPEGIGSTKKQDFIVKVSDNSTGNPVASAVVVLTRDLKIIAATQTDALGNARIQVSDIGAGDLDITVTSKFYIPFMDKIKVANNGAFINILDPENGIATQDIFLGGKSFDANESIKIYFDGVHIKTTNATAGEFGQANSFTFKVPNGKPLGLYNVLAIGQTSGRYAVDVFQVRDVRIVDLYTYSQWDESTWHLEPNNQKVWNSPEIWLEEAGGGNIASNNLVVGDNYKLNARVYNGQNNNANSVKVTFKWAQHGIGQVVWDNISTETINVPANGNKIATVNWSPAVSGHVCVKAEISHIEDINSKNNSGQENCHVGAAASPAKLEFMLCNPTDKPAMVFIEVYQHLTKGAEGRPMQLWGSFVEHPDPQLLKPGECRKATIIVDPDFCVGKVTKGDIAKFTVSGYINRQLIGGIDLEIVKK